MLPDHLLLLLLRESLNECEWIDGSRMAESKEHAIGRGESECPVSSGPGLPQALWDSWGLRYRGVNRIGRVAESCGDLIRVGLAH